MKIAFVTYAKAPDLTPDDRILAQYLSQKNITIVPVLWDDEAIDWYAFDAIIIRATWDYFERPQEFNQWLDRLEPLAHKVWNPLSVVKWNQDKRYFDDFTKKGIGLPPYIICPRNGKANLKQIMEDNGWRKAVVKPAISGGAYHTWVVHTDTAVADQPRFAALQETGDVIVQVFVEEILTHGELSLVFFDKKFSHAICKKAKPGDFRVQTEFGGSITAIQPDEAALMQATALVNSMTEPLLYARVDGVAVEDGRFLLMELELIEPNLFVFSHEQACENFYAALEAVLALQGTSLSLETPQSHGF
jgi:hypothetical protein